MKITFESEGDLPFGKTFSISDMIIVAASFLKKNGKYYPQMFLHECAYKLQECYRTKKLDRSSEDGIKGKLIDGREL